MPASDINVTFCPPGPTNSTSISSPQLWLNPLKVTVTLLVVPLIPVTLIVEGYGVALPTLGIVIAVVLVNEVVVVLDEFTATTKLVLVLFGPSLTVTVIVALCSAGSRSSCRAKMPASRCRNCKAFTFTLITRAAAFSR